MHEGEDELYYNLNLEVCFILHISLYKIFPFLRPFHVYERNGKFSNSTNKIILYEYILSSSRSI